MLRLFAGDATLVTEDTRVGEGVHTPFGTVSFTATANGREVLATEPDVWRLSDGAWIERWETSAMELERLTCQLDPDLPEGMRVDGCWGAVWRFLAHQKIAHFTVAARLAAVPSPGGFGDSGQYLAAVAFESDACQMHIGTQDEDALAERACAGTLPARWCYEDMFTWTEPWYDSLRLVRWWRTVVRPFAAIRYELQGPHYPYDTFTIASDPAGVSVSLLPLVAGDCGELQFVVAWTTPRDDVEDDISTFEAVDWDPRHVVWQAGCKYRFPSL